MAKPIVRAVAYYRMSSDQQPDSISQQQAQIPPLCEREGVVIEREFGDHAISGDKTSKRDDFHAMLRFCQERHREGRPIEAIVCWDASRFSRATSIETNHYIWEFQQSGVNRLLTASGKWIDWRKEEDRVLFNVQQDMTNHRYLRDLSRNIARGKLDNAREGYFNGGPVPYGFDRMLVNERDEPQRRIKRGEKLGYKEKGWNCILVPSEDPRELETVRWLYVTFASTDTSLRELANELNRRGVPAPGTCSSWHDGPTLWQYPTIKWILLSPHYCGDGRWGVLAKGAYHRIVEGTIQETGGRLPPQQNAEPGSYNRDAHVGIIDRATWERVQQKLLAKRREGRKPQARGLLLTGILYCGHCGARMYGNGLQTKPHKNGRLYAYKRYVCRTYMITGPEACDHYSMREDHIVPALVRRLQETYLAPGPIERLRAELQAQAEARQVPDPDQLPRMRTRLTELDGDIRQATKNVLRATANVDLLQEELSALRRQRNDLARDVEALERTQHAPAADVEQLVDAAVACLRTLQERLQDANPKLLREVLLQLVARIDLYFEQGERKKGQWHRFERGEVKLRPQLELSGCEEDIPVSPAARSGP